MTYKKIKELKSENKTPNAPSNMPEVERDILLVLT